MAIPASRDEQIANFYREHAARLHRGICGKTVGLDDATVQDACATAWERLLGRPDIDLERYEAYWWLYKVALREAWALGRRQRREQPVGGLNGADEDSLEPVDLDSDVGGRRGRAHRARQHARGARKAALARAPRAGPLRLRTEL